LGANRKREKLVKLLTHSGVIRMIICMRTTLIIDDELLQRAKRFAAEHNVTVSDLVNNALRECLGRPAPEAAPFSLITYGRSSKRVQHEASEFASALEHEDLDRLRRC
jgi:antitoxin component of RelBE/YafQ-DinJ toxin-antitoxin module